MHLFLNKDKIWFKVFCFYIVIWFLTQFCLRGAKSIRILIVVGIVALLKHCRMPSSVYYQYTCTFFQSQERGCDADIACGLPSGCAVPRLAPTNRPATPGIPIKATTTLKTHLSFEWKFPKNNSA